MPGSDVWEVGAAYEAYIGRWSRPVARAFVGWLGVDVGSSWLDVGCGSGALVAAIRADASPVRVVGIDRSEGFVAEARRRLGGEGVEFRVGDALALPVDDAAFDATVSGLVLNFVAEPARMVAELVRATCPGGTVGVYVWDYGRGMELLRRFWDAARAVDPAAATLDEAVRFPGCTPPALASLFQGAGLQAVTTRAIDVPTRFRDFDDYWSPFLGGQGPAPTYVGSLEEESRNALRERLWATLPAEPGGSISLTARAWAVRGVRPG